MTTLRLYLLREILATLAMTVGVFTGLLLLGNLLKDALVLIVGQQLSLALFAQVLGLLVPYVLAFALPMGLLCACLLVFGRLSADSELVAMRASGVGLASLVWPMVALAIGLSALCAWMSLELTPRARVEFKGLMRSLAQESSGMLINEGQFMAVGGFTYYVGKVDGDRLEDIEVYQSNTATQQWIRAESGRLAVDRDQGLVSITLTDWRITRLTETNFYSGEFIGDYALPPFPLPGDREVGEAKISNMSFSQLRAKLAELRAQMEADDRALSVGLTEEQREVAQRERRAFTARIRVQMHRMVSFSFACVGFTLIGIPLGIRAHRRETSAGIALALGLVLVYYGFFVLGQSLPPDSALDPAFVLWAPNLLFQAMGGWLIWRADRGAR